MSAPNDILGLIMEGLIGLLLLSGIPWAISIQKNLAVMAAKMGMLVDTIEDTRERVEIAHKNIADLSKSVAVVQAKMEGRR